MKRIETERKVGSCYIVRESPLCMKDSKHTGLIPGRRLSMNMVIMAGRGGEEDNILSIDVFLYF